MAGTYQWLSFSDAKSQLAARLADSGKVFWTDAELGIYVCQALRQFNCLTTTWKKDFVFYNNGPGVWNSLATLAGSPRFRTLFDTYCYTQMQYMLLEPPTGQVWTGTSQFNINDFSDALQGSRDEMLQVSACNEAIITLSSTPNTSRVLLPDTVIDVPRLRYIPYTATGNSGITLYRDDAVALEFYDPPLYQLTSQPPETYSLSSEPPLAFDVFPPPNIPATYEALVIQSGAPFVPPTPTLLNVPDDYSWVLIHGALAQLLGRDSEATDRERAAYSAQRYQDGLTLMMKTPWIMLGKVNGAAVTVDALEATDRYSPNWDSNPAGFGPAIITAGIDMFASPTSAGIGLTVLASAPVPVLDSDFVQVSRSNIDVVMDLAQATSSYKLAGAEWKAALELEQRAIQACANENNRLKSIGAFADVFLQRGQLQDMNQNRYNSKPGGQQ